MNVKKRETDDDKLGVDVFGSELTGLGLTFCRAAAQAYISNKQ